MAEVQTYTKGDKNIVLIDMVHVAPKSFYKDVKKVLKSYKDTSSIILEEGVQLCSVAGDIAYLPGENADFNALAKLYENRNDFDTASAESALRKAGFIKIKCLKGSSNSRPGIIDRFSSRFSLYGLIAGLGFVRSQGSLSVYPRGMEIESGDISSSRFESPITNALAGSVVQCMLAVGAEGGCVPFKTWSSTPKGEKLVEDIIMDQRNEVLLGATFTSLGISTEHGSEYNFQANNGATYNTVILPWGAAHMGGGLNKAIEAKGFMKSAKGGIKYTDCARVKRNLLLRAILSEDEAVKKGCKL